MTLSLLCNCHVKSVCVHVMQVEDHMTSHDITRLDCYISFSRCVQVLA